MGCRASPRPHDTAWWGGSRLTRKNCRPLFHFKRQSIVATALRHARFKPRPIENIAMEEVAPAFEPQKASGRGASTRVQCYGCSVPAALSCCACFQHEARRDYSNSHVV